MIGKTFFSDGEFFGLYKNSAIDFHFYNNMLADTLVLFYIQARNNLILLLLWDDNQSVVY